MINRIAILGAGNFGTALAQHLAGSGARVVLWDFLPEVVEEINVARANSRYLPGVVLHESISAVTTPSECVREAGLVIIAVHSPYVAHTLEQALPGLPSEAFVLSAAKGIDSVVHQPIHLLVARLAAPRPLVVLAGPVLANEFSRGKPTAIVLASAIPGAAERLCPLFEREAFRVATTDDVDGAGLGGVLKNVYAILFGFIETAAAAESNFQAALLTAAANEMAHIGVALGARRETFLGLAGLGDLVATCFSPESHHHQFGARLGRGQSTAEIEAEIGLLPEGARTAVRAYEWAREKGVAAPLADFVRQLVAGPPPPLTALYPHLA